MQTLKKPVDLFMLNKFLCITDEHLYDLTVKNIMLHSHCLAVPTDCYYGLSFQQLSLQKILQIRSHKIKTNYLI